APVPPVTAAMAEERKDRMITLPGPKKSPKAGRSAPLFEGLNMSMGKVRGVGDTQGREGGAPTEITRKTIVKAGQAPKDTVFGLKDIRVEQAPGKAAEGTSGVGVPRATRPKEETLSPRDIRAGQERAKDALFTSRNIQVKGSARPADSSLLSRGRGKVPAAGQPKELDPGRRGLEVIDPSAAGKQAGKPGKKHGEKGRKDDEEIGWIH
ncbi:MAG: hypothetical protein LUQ32_00740, partial [Methanomicrobiales archaeon]|nr:hypothetical protein [Methanomicrobiales archaeon]